MISAEARCQEALRVFRKAQMRQRRWICFEEIAQWYGEYQASRRKKLQDETRFEDMAYDLLCSDVRNGRFDRDGRSRVWFLSLDIGLVRATGPLAEEALSICRGPSGEIDHGILRSAYLDQWWISRNDFTRWLKEHHLPTSPPRFEPQPEPGKRSTIGDETRAKLALSELLAGQHLITRKEAWDAIKRSHTISKRGFDRIWPEARQLAGLPAKASPGRKSRKRN